MFRKLVSEMFLIILVVSFAQSVSLSQSQFEGKVKFQVTDESGKSTMLDYFVKDKKFRMEGPESQGAFIFDAASNKMMILMDAQKMYMEIPFDLNKEMSKSKEEAKGDFKATGETKDILGYKCEKFIYTDKDTKNEMWLTKELGGKKFGVLLASIAAFSPIGNFFLFYFICGILITFSKIFVCGCRQYRFQ